jgi:hypothetical protein
MARRQTTIQPDDALLAQATEVARESLAKTVRETDFRRHGMQVIKTRPPFQTLSVAAAGGRKTG